MSCVEHETYEDSRSGPAGAASMGTAGAME